MPNWCNNVLELEHEDPAMITRAKKAFLEGKLLNEFVPVPESLHIVAGRVGDPDEQKKLEEDTARNLATHGYGNWYDYCVNEWGTKWDVGGDDCYVDDTGPNNATMSFDSAWAPPVAAMEKFMDQGFKVTLYYYECGMCFAGIMNEDGDDCYDFSDMSADEVEAEIPAELDIKFCITETMRDYEEEEKDDVQIWYEDGVNKLEQKEQK
jgi:hypothetical protein